MRYEIDDQPTRKVEPCRFCGALHSRSGMLSHARHAHPAQFILWIEGRGGYGMSIWEHVGAGYVEKSVTRT